MVKYMNWFKKSQTDSERKECQTSQADDVERTMRRFIMGGEASNGNGKPSTSGMTSNSQKQMSERDMTIMVFDMLMARCKSLELREKFYISIIALITGINVTVEIVTKMGLI